MYEHIFISYKSQQRDYAMQIYEALKDWGLDPWLDVQRLQPGSEWANEIDKALKTCQAVLGIMTPESIGSRYVTNEWDMAIVKGKLFIPLLFEDTDPHYKYIDIQYIDFRNEDKSKSYEILRKRLTGREQSVAIKSDPYSGYLQQLFDRINAYLEQKLIPSLRNENNPEPVHIKTKTEDNLVDLFLRPEQIDPLFVAGGIQPNYPDKPPQVFEDFGKAFSQYNGRVLILGEPGAGKTITLLQHARDLIVLRQQDPSLPVPILGMIYTWDASNKSPISNWLSISYGTPKNTIQLIEEGKAVLLLDGLDELGNERLTDSKNPASPKFDPRQRFLQNLPRNNQLVITCRTQNYLEINEKAPVNGVVTLKPLGDAQIRQYLHKQPELLALMESDSDLRNWLRTPLLLSFFAFAYEGMDLQDKEKLKKLNTSYELREFIFNEYINKRFQHEERKARIRKEKLSYTPDEILSYLGTLALDTLVVFFKYEIETFAQSLNPIVDQSRFDRYYQQLHSKWSDGDSAGLLPKKYKDDEKSLLMFAAQLNFLIFSEEEFHFPHILLRNHFAYMGAIKLLEKMKPVHLEKATGIFRKKKPVEITIGEGESFKIIQAIVALRTLNDPRAIPFIEPFITVRGWITFGYHEMAWISSEAEHAIRVLQSVTDQGEKKGDPSTEDPLF